MRRVKAVYMYNDISRTDVVRHKPRGRLYRVGSAALTICGGLTFTLALTRFISDAAAAWSPTATARVCFSYPDEQSLPDSDDIGQYLLSQAFFRKRRALLRPRRGEHRSMRAAHPVLPASPETEGEVPESPIDEPDSSDDNKIPRKHGHIQIRLFAPARRSARAVTL